MIIFIHFNIIPCLSITDKSQYSLSPDLPFIGTYSRGTEIFNYIFFNVLKKFYSPDTDRLFWRTCWAKTWFSARSCSLCFFSSDIFISLSLSFPDESNILLQIKENIQLTFNDRSCGGVSQHSSDRISFLQPCSSLFRWSFIRLK